MASPLQNMRGPGRPLRAITPDQVRRLLTHVNRGTAVGRRDYAILLLLARLGLRAGEIAFLDLNDIDWKAGCAHVPAFILAQSLGALAAIPSARVLFPSVTSAAAN